MLPLRLAQLRLRDLLLLEHLSNAASLTEVATRMNVTQSAITQALKSLEQAFGCALFERGRRGQRGVGLLPAGQAALAHVRVALHEMQAASRVVQTPGASELRIGALPLALVQPLPEALERLRKRMPQVHLVLSEDTVPRLWRQIEAGELDAIVCRPPALGDNPRLPDGVAHRVVGHESLVVLCGRQHPLAARRKLPVAVLQAYDWVLPPQGTYMRLAVEQCFLRASLPAPRVVITSANFHSNMRLAARSHLLAVAPRSAALSVKDALGLQLFPLDWSGGDEAISLAWRESSVSKPELAAFLECF